MIAQFEKQAVTLDCICKDEKTADSVMQVVYNATEKYFDVLAKLSENELVDYSFNTLTKPLKEGNFGGLIINDREVNAYGKISAILSRVVLDAYRKRKLSQFIGEANEHIQVLLQAMAVNLQSNLEGRLKTQQERINSYYFDLLEDAGTSAYDKKKIIEEYHRSTDELEGRKKKLNSYARGLNAIAKGHQEIYTNRNRLKAKDFRSMLSGYAADLREITDEFNKIKNED